MRRWRLGRRGCPVFFYTRGEIGRLVEEAGSRLIELRTVGKIYFVVGGGGAGGDG